MLSTVLLVILVLILVGALPQAPWGAWHGLGLYPSSLAGLFLILLLIVVLMGRL